MGLAGDKAAKSGISYVKINMQLRNNLETENRGSGHRHPTSSQALCHFDNGADLKMLPV